MAKFKGGQIHWGPGIKTADMIKGLSITISVYLIFIVWLKSQLVKH